MKGTVVCDEGAEITSHKECANASARGWDEAAESAGEDHESRLSIVEKGGGLCEGIVRIFSAVPWIRR